MSQLYLALCAPGLEPQLNDELSALGARKREKMQGAVGFEGTYTVAYRVHLASRLCTRLYLRVAEDLRATNRPELFNRLSKIDWERWLPGDLPVEIKAYARRSRLNHTGIIEEVAMHALRARMSEHDLAMPREEWGEEEQPQRLMMRLYDDRLSVRLDMSGEILHKRGWREAAGDAPLRETIAAGCLAALGWDGSTSLVDPMCGAGTIPIEAASIAAGRLPRQLDHAYSFVQWTNFDAARLERLHAELLEERPARAVTIMGRDIDEEVLELARGNAESAGLSQEVDLAPAPVAELSLEGIAPGLIMSNPPYGARLAQDEQPAHEVLAARFVEQGWGEAGWRVGLLLPAGQRPSEREGLRWERLQGLQNGGLSVALWAGEAG